MALETDVFNLQIDWKWSLNPAFIASVKYRYASLW